MRAQSARYLQLSFFFLCRAPHLSEASGLKDRLVLDHSLDPLHDLRRQLIQMLGRLDILRYLFRLAGADDCA